MLNLEWTERDSLHVLVDVGANMIVNYVRWSDSEPPQYVDFEGRELSADLDVAKLTAELLTRERMEKKAQDCSFAEDSNA